MVVTGTLLLWTNIPFDNVFGIVGGVLNVVSGVGFFVIALVAHRRATRVQ